MLVLCGVRGRAEREVCPAGAAGGGERDQERCQVAGPRHHRGCLGTQVRGFCMRALILAFHLCVCVCVTVCFLSCARVSLSAAGSVQSRCVCCAVPSADVDGVCRRAEPTEEEEEKEEGGKANDDADGE
eukprot:3055407-Rhodomonas_salina.10